jgi:hypothetical protein
MVNQIATLANGSASYDAMGTEGIYESSIGTYTPTIIGAQQPSNGLWWTVAFKYTGSTTSAPWFPRLVYYDDLMQSGNFPSTTGQTGKCLSATAQFGVLAWVACSGGGGDTITSPNSTLNVGGTASNTTLDVAGTAGKILAGATPALTYTPALGVDGSSAGTLQLANGSSPFHTIIGTQASANWTFKLPATAGVNTYVLETDGSGNTSWAAQGASGDSITSPNSTITLGGTSTATTVDLAGAAGKIMAGATPGLTFTPQLGVDNTNAGTLTLSNGSAIAHTIFGSAATTTNTILGPATVIANGHVVTCTTSSTTCTLTDGGAPASFPGGTGVVRVASGTPSAAELSGDATTSGSNAVTVVKVNGATVPASATALASNSSNQIIAATYQGNGAKVQLSTSTTTTNDCVKFDANGNTVDAGAACGAGSGTVTSSGTPTAHQTPVWTTSTNLIGVGPGTSGYVWTSNGASSDPSWQARSSSGSTFTVCQTDLGPVSADDGLITLFNPASAIHINRFSCGVTGTTSVITNMVKGGNSLIADATCTAGDANTVVVTTFANGSSQCGGTTSCAVAAHTPVTIHVGTISGTPTGVTVCADATVD